MIEKKVEIKEMRVFLVHAMDGPRHKDKAGGGVLTSPAACTAVTTGRDNCTALHVLDNLCEGACSGSKKVLHLT